MQGNWHDFTSKYGFRDGEGVTSDDFEARSRLVELLNEHPGMISSGLRALEFNRSGFHNPCLVIVLQRAGVAADDELYKQWSSGAITDQPLPESAAAEIDELVAAAYEDWQR